MIYKINGRPLADWQAAARMKKDEPLALTATDETGK